MSINYLKKLVYALVAAGVFSARAGSYDDFFVAIRKDDPAVLTDLLRRGFDPNTPDAKGQPGLTIAVREHSLKAILRAPTRALVAQGNVLRSCLLWCCLPPRSWLDTPG